MGECRLRRKHKRNQQHFCDVCRVWEGGGGRKWSIDWESIWNKRWVMSLLFQLYLFQDCFDYLDSLESP